MAEVVTFLISHNPDGKIRVDIIQPGFKGIRIAGVAEQTGCYNGAAGRIMPAVGTVGIRNATGDFPVPGKIGTILPERSAEPDVGGRIHARIGTGIKVMQPIPVCVRHRAVMGKQTIARIF